MEASLSPQCTADTSPTISYCAGIKAQPFVRLMADALSELSDDALQAYILGCAERFLEAQRRWEKTGCFAAIGDRDAWWHSEADALIERGNRPWGRA